MGEARELVLPLLDLGAKLVECQCSIRRATKQYRGSDKDAARGADQRKQLERGGSDKAEAAKKVRREWQ